MQTDALELFISKQTVELHYGKHHQAYIDNLNKLIKRNSRTQTWKQL